MRRGKYPVDLLAPGWRSARAIGADTTRAYFAYLRVAPRPAVWPVARSACATLAGLPQSRRGADAAVKTPRVAANLGAQPGPTHAHCAARSRAARLREDARKMRRRLASPSR